MKDQLIIVGASGHGKVVADIALKMNKWKAITFLDDNGNLKESLGLQVIGKSSDAFKYIDDFDIFIAIGNNDVRKKLQTDLEQKNASIPILIHPNAVIGTHVKIDYGTVIMAGVIINSDTKIGKGCIINTGTTVDHDNMIEDYVHLSPGVNLAGGVKIGDKTWLGIGSMIINNVNITSGCIIGAGSVVVADIIQKGIYVGVPAKKKLSPDNFEV